MWEQFVDFDSTSVSLPLTFFGNRPVVEVMLEGKGPFAFIVDTGAGGTVVAQDLATELHLAITGETEMGSPMGSQRIPAHIVRIGKLDLGLAMEGLAGYGYHENPWLAGLPEKRKNILRKLGVMPAAVDTMVSEMMHRTTMGVDANTDNLLLAGLKCAMADYVALKMSTDTADILFGSPKLSVSKAGLGVLKKEAVNVAVHGHNPVLSEMP